MRAVRAFDRLAFIVLLFRLNFHRLNQPAFRVGLEVLNHALRHEEDREDQANAKQQVVNDAHEVHPEIAERSGRMSRDAPHQRRCQSNADGCGGEILDDQPDHLREIRHGAFAAIVLPVLLVKLAAVLKARSGLTGPSLCGLSGSKCCKLKMT